MVETPEEGSSRYWRGLAAEEIVKDLLPEMGCKLVKQYRGHKVKEGESNPLRPDLDVQCGDDPLKVIEVKESVLYEKDGTHSSEGFQQYRMGRFQLSPDGKTVIPFPKQCYALVVDDQIGNSVTVDFVKANKIDAEFERLITKTDEEGNKISGGAYPKFNVYRLFELREDQRCFPDYGTFVLDRDQLLMYMDRSFDILKSRQPIKHKRRRRR